MAGTKYQEFLDAVAAYYGSGSDQWVEIARYGTSADNFEAIVNQLPNYRVVKSESGNVLGYERFSSWNTPNAASKVNSNLQAGSRNSIQTYTPASTGLDSQTQKVTATKNITTSSGTQFITKTVVPAVMAAGVGISLGKTIDATLYNLNPDFWDSRGMGTLNPESWRDITTGMNGNVGELALGTAFNMLFGINPNTGQMQAYTDEEAFAYMALWLTQQGVFSNSTDMIPPAEFELNTPITETTNNRQFTYYTQSRYVNYATDVLDGDTKICFYHSSTETEKVFNILASQVNRTITCVSHRQQYDTRTGQWYAPYDVTETFTTNSSYTYDNKTAYYRVYSMGAPEEGKTMYMSPPLSADNTSNDMGKVAWTLLYGTPTGGVEGFGNQNGATLPNLTGDMTIADVLAALQSQYPQLFNNAVNYPVLQPDGTEKNYVYIPVAMPNASSSTDTQPTGDGEYYTQLSPYYDPSTDSDESVWEWVWNIINPDNDDTTPDDTTDEGGNGDSPVPILPTGSASALWKIYNPSQTQLDTFGAWLWSPNFVDQLLKVFNDPMQAIIGLHKIFVTPPISGSGPIKVGYLVSDASANYVSGQYVDLDCGEISLAEHFGNVFDYHPFTSIRLYLPFVGIVDLDTADTMRGSIKVMYHVDVLTGTCLAEVRVSRDTAGGTLYTFTGNCAVQYPVSSGSYVGMITGALGLAGTLIGSYVSGGAMLPAVLRAGANIGNMHANVQHSGNLGANSGAMGIKKPYLIIERSQQEMPKRYTDVHGYPTYVVNGIGAISGFARIIEIDLKSNATDAEQEEIEELLRSGVFVC